MQSTSCEMPGWVKHKLESRLPGKISITSDMQMTPSLLQKAKRNGRASWWKWRVKSWLKTQHSKNEDHGIWPHHFMENRCDVETIETVTNLIFLGSKITTNSDTSHEIKRCSFLERKAINNLDSILKSRHYFANKGPSSQSYGFSSSRVWMWELDHTESWALKNWCFWTVVLEKTLESPLDHKEVKPVNPKGNQSWICLGRTDVEDLILWPPDANNWLIVKDLDSRKHWRQ